MKKTIVKTVMAASMLFSMVLGQGEGTVAVAATSATTKAPVMTDNLFKYGLKKDVELPVTVTAGGLSYTLEKIMIYDIKSATAQELIKKYGYNNYGKYFVWTKITIENKGKTVIEESAKDPNPKWSIGVGDGGVLLQDMPLVNVRKKNSKEALWDYTLKPGEKLTTYQGFLNTGSFNHIVIWLDVKGSSAEKYIVNRKE
ncbi:hypothetical protein [Paenibacillus wynnii]|uniref:hypothetical protein n=1 Tax=Paenibacillus wynnii TaxID=268407 RepID=UPI00278DDD1E|nr:hypothetical protein [Paenibacillus wynnii]MDQ0195496.1 hypothetical protein [Paenibacillus wynnii]